MSACVVWACPRKTITKDLCSTHYERIRKFGSAFGVSQSIKAVLSKAIIEREEEEATRIMNKSYQELHEIAMDNGWRYRDTGSNHRLYYSPDGQHTITMAKGTPSDRRAYDAAKAEFKRKGLDVDAIIAKAKVEAEAIDVRNVLTVTEELAKPEPVEVAPEPAESALFQLLLELGDQFAAYRRETDAALRRLEEQVAGLKRERSAAAVSSAEVLAAWRKRLEGMQ